VWGREGEGKVFGEKTRRKEQEKVRKRSSRIFSGVLQFAMHAHACIDMQYYPWMPMPPSMRLEVDNASDVYVNAQGMYLCPQLIQ
jgi:hypothetical protein